MTAVATKAAANSGEASIRPFQFRASDEALAECRRLGATGRVERRICVALPAMLEVPVGLSMAGNEERRHRRR